MPRSFFWGHHVTVAPLTLTAISSQTSVQNQSYSYQLTATGGITPYTFSCTNLPKGLSCSTSGLISGTPSAVATYNPVVATVMDSSATPLVSHQTFSFTINAPPSLGTITWATGFTPSASTDQSITGTCPTSFTFPHVYQIVGDATILFIFYTTTSTSISAIASSNNMSKSWALVERNVDNFFSGGLTLDVWQGIVNGTSADDNVTISYINSSLSAAFSGILPLSVTLGLSSIPIAWSIVRAGQTTTAGGVTTTPAYPSLLSATTTNPQGYFAYAASGDIMTGGITATYTAVDSTNTSNELGYKLSIGSNATAAPTSTSTSALNDTVGFIITAASSSTLLSVAPIGTQNATLSVLYSQGLSSSGGTVPITWTWAAQAGSSLPPGLSLSGATISGTPTVVGTYNVTVMATDSTSPTPQTASQPFSIVVSATVVTGGVPTVTSVSPSAGITTGGTLITVTGTNFSNFTGITNPVLVGGLPALNVVVVNSTEITAVTPAQGSTVAAPTITGISTTTGSTSGGTNVTITGSNFANFTGITNTVLFGTVPATNVVVVNTTQITCTSPAGTGTVDIRVVNTGGTSPASTADQFTYTTPTGFPFATSLSGASGGPSRHNILDQNGNPWLMIGDSAWALMLQLNSTNQATYFSTRKSQGFNCILVGAFVTPYIGGSNDTLFPNYNGTNAFTSACTSSNWLSTPNTTYWNTVVAMVQLAATYGMTIMLDPLDTGWLIDQNAYLQNNSVATCTAYGQFLGNLLGGQPNVIWSSGNDYGWSTANDAYVLGIAKGINSVAVASKQLQTVELWSTGQGYGTQTPNKSTDDSAWPTALAGVFLNGVYSYPSPYTLCQQGYALSPNFPVFGAEYNYEGEDNTDIFGTTTPQMIRAQAYWTATCGTSGQLYGNHWVWGFLSGWQSHLTDAGAVDMSYLANLFNSVAWYNLVPDTGHTFMTSGYGTSQGTGGDPATDNYCTAALTSDGTLGIVYIPQSGTNPVIALSKMATTITARWYDPTLGTYQTAGSGTYANNGTATFTPPAGAHGDGSHDWVLVLQA